MYNTVVLRECKVKLFYIFKHKSLDYKHIIEVDSIPACEGLGGLWHLGLLWHLGHLVGLG